MSGGAGLVGVSGCGQGIAKHGEGPGLGGSGAQLLPEPGRLGEVLDGLVVAPLEDAEPAQLVERHGAKAELLDLRRPQFGGRGHQPPSRVTCSVRPVKSATSGGTWHGASRWDAGHDPADTPPSPSGTERPASSSR